MRDRLRLWFVKLLRLRVREDRRCRMVYGPNVDLCKKPRGHGGRCG